jgi:hypothetical protein
VGVHAFFRVAFFSHFRCYKRRRWPSRAPTIKRDVSSCEGPENKI